MIGSLMGHNPEESKKEESVGFKATYHIRDPALRALLSQNDQTPIPLTDLPHLEAAKPLALQNIGKSAFSDPYDEDETQDQIFIHHQHENQQNFIFHFWKEFKLDIKTSFAQSRPVVFLGSFMLGIGGYFALPIEPSWSALLIPLCMSLCFCLIALKYQATLSIFVAMSLAIGGAVVSKYTSLNYQQAKIIPPQHVSTLVGRVYKVQKRKNGYSMLIKPLEMSSRPNQDLPKRVMIYSRIDEALPELNEIILVKTVLDAPSGASHPDGFDFSFYYHFRDIGGIGFSISKWQKTDLSNVRLPIDQSLLEKTGLTLEKQRMNIAQRIETALPHQSGAFAKALLIGDRSGIDEPALEALRKSGLAHILAISGMHVALVSGTIFAFIRLFLVFIPSLGVKIRAEKWAALGALCAAIIYLVYSGAAISTWRAVIMMGIFYVAIMMSRPALTTRNVIIAAVLILLIWPFSMLEAGFQMSFAATLALIIAFSSLRFWSKRSVKTKPRSFSKTNTSIPKGILLFAAKFFGFILFSSFVAGFATMPFALYHFDNFAPLGLVGNILAMPIISLIVMPFGILAMVFMPYGLEATALKVMGYGIDLINQIAFAVSAHSLSKITPPDITLSMVLCTALALLMLIFLHKRALILLLPLVLMGYFWPSSPKPDILIAQKNYTIALKTGAEKYEIFGRDSQTRRDWEKHYEVVDEKQHSPLLNCNKISCIIPTQKKPILLVRNFPAKIRECSEYSLIILASKKVNANKSCKLGHVDQPVIFSYKDFIKSGGMAIYFAHNRDTSQKVTQPYLIKNFNNTARPWSAYYTSN